ETLEPRALARDHVERRRTRRWIFCDAFAQRVDVAADRGQRRAELVGDAHQEVALPLLGLRQPPGHVTESIGEVSDLTAPAHIRDVDRIATPRDLVRRVREREHRLRDPAGQVPRQQACDEDPTHERERESTEERCERTGDLDRKSTRLNSSHGSISYAVFCLKKKKQEKWKER